MKVRSGLEQHKLARQGCLYTAAQALAYEDNTVLQLFGVR